MFPIDDSARVQSLISMRNSQPQDCDFDQSDAVNPITVMEIVKSAIIELDYVYASDRFSLREF